MDKINHGNIRCPYAVGDVLTTFNPMPPAERWPDTDWQKIECCFLLVADLQPHHRERGGKEKCTLTIDDMPAHTQSLCMESCLSGSSIIQSFENTGDNIPAYRAHYMWERTG